MAETGSTVETTEITEVDQLKKQSQKRSGNDETNLKSPSKKIRLELPKPAPKTERTNKESKFIYGNYNRYYGYRCEKNFEDIRLNAFKNYTELFDSKEILDIGCNDGFITIAIAKRFPVAFITGFDIDKSLIATARKNVIAETRGMVNNNDKTILKESNFPANIAFKCCNYVLSDDRLLELEEPRYDTILCLSVTKWIHLNFGDDGLKRAFKRMFRQLKPGGTLILESQNWKGYKRRKNLSPAINVIYKSIKFFPNQFNEFLLGEDVGFSSAKKIELSTEHSAEGFKRPIFAFKKNSGIRTEEICEDR